VNRLVHIFSSARWSSGYELSDWVSAIHPSGGLYFVHKEKVTHRAMESSIMLTIHAQNIFTDALIFEPDNMNIINYVSEVLFSRMGDLIRDFGADSNRAPEFELVLDLTQYEDGVTKCGYYFVDNSSRCLFWLDEFDARSICAIPIVSHSHLGELSSIRFHSVFSV
jgi:hypothetical protein